MAPGKGFFRHFHKGGTPQNNVPTVPEPPAREHYGVPDQTGQTSLGVSSEQWRYYEPPRIDQYVFDYSPDPLSYGTEPSPLVLQPMPFIKENADSQTSNTVSPSNG
jgi:hypothetical protein